MENSSPLTAEVNGDRPEGNLVIEAPGYGFVINPDSEGAPLWIGLQVQTSGTQCQFFLCRAADADIQQVARSFNRELMRVSTTLKRTARGLIVAKGVDSSVLRAERRQEGR